MDEWKLALEEDTASVDDRVAASIAQILRQRRTQLDHHDKRAFLDYCGQARK